MGESACLLNSFSLSTPTSQDATSTQGTQFHALGESISFGRFMSEPLAWEKWSTFSHKRYVEEARSYARPGSVAQKKAFFEAHYKSIAARKAAAAATTTETLVEQPNDAADNSPQPEPEPDDGGVAAADSQVHVDEPLEQSVEGDSTINGNNYSPNAEMKEVETERVRVADLVTETGVLGENSVKSHTLNQVENVADEEAPLLISKTKPALSSSESETLHRRAPKPSVSPAKPAAPIPPRRKINALPVTRKSMVPTADTKRSTRRSLHEMIYCTPAKGPDKPTTLAAHMVESSRVAPSPNKESKDCRTPLRTLITASSNGELKHPSATPCSKNIRSTTTTPLHPTAAGSKTIGPKWNILSTVCSKSLSVCRNKLQSPTLCIPFSLRTEERAARRKQRLEEKFNSQETQEVRLQTRVKEKVESERKGFCRSLCFKAPPMPDHCGGRETTKDQMKNEKIPLTHSQSPRKIKPNSSITSQLTTSLPPETASAKNRFPNNITKRKSQVPNLLGSLGVLIISNENSSPNIHSALLTRKESREL
ncbi:protein WVD2-like 7 [Diospyros lotus]|uniref:protein WVD2-like 7 n=1 Tax=Diospyros lotus TaxID=55363 RepID=UPI0022504E38|nr:protein WVD2-like 7 [Diospyros lotus]